MNDKQPSHPETLQFTKLRIIKNLMVISFSFLLLFTSYNGLSMLQSTMNKKQGIGIISQATIYASFLLSCLVLPKYCLKKLGCKTTLLIAIFMYIFYIAANFYPTWGTLIPAAFLSGFGASILWGSQCTYFNISSVLYCTACNLGAVKKVNEESEVPSNCTSIETLTSRGTEFNSTDNISSLSITSRTKEMVYPSETNVPSSTRSRNSSVTSMKNDIQGLPALTNFRRQSSGYENGFFPPREIFVDLRADIQASQSSMSNIEEGNRLKENKSEAQKSLNSLARIEFITPLFFGLHGLMYHSSMIWGNMMSYYVLLNDDRLSNVTDNGTSNFTCNCGASFCSGMSGCTNSLLSEPTTEMRYLLTGISVTLGVLSFLLVLFFLDQLGSDKEPIKFSLDVMMATFNHGKKKEQIFLVPLSIYVGMMQGFYIGDYTKSYIACAMGTYKIGLVTMFYGVTCAVSSTLSGWLVRHMGRIPIFLIGEAINIGTNVFLLMWRTHPDDSHLFFLGALLWGIFTGIFWSQLPALNGILFKDDEEAAFAYYYLCGSVGYIISFICSDLICTNYKIYILLAVSSVGMVGYFITERIHYLKTKQT